ncbi:wax ester/triacylglycerol synthase domain-containing protein [Cellulomonas soli]
MAGARIGAGDLVEWLTDVGPAPKQVGAVLVLGGSGIDAMGVERVLVERFGMLRRFGQRLEQSGRGRPRWVDAGAESIAGQVGRLTCPAPGDVAALLAVATDALTRPLDRTGPLWRAEVVDGLAGGGVAVVLVLHHVLADGLGGLAVLSRLVDDASQSAPVGRAAGAPGASRRSGAPRPVVRPVDASAVRVRRRIGAPRTSLNVPTGPRRVTLVAEAELAAVKAAGRTRGATVNDVLLVVVAGAAGRLLRARGRTSTRWSCPWRSPRGRRMRRTGWATTSG